MVMFLTGKTGTPRLLDGTAGVFDPVEMTVIVNTGDDMGLGGHLVYPNVDAALFADGGILGTDRW